MHINAMQKPVNFDLETAPHFKAHILNLWGPLFEEAGTTYQDPEAFAKVSMYLKNSGFFEAFQAHFPVGKLKLFGTSKDPYYLYLSGLQKAIRFGLPEDALRYFRTLKKNGFASQATARLKTIFLEDIGVGDPLLCLYLLDALSGPTPFRDETVEYLIVTACNTTKSRTQTDVIQPLYYKGRYADVCAVQKGRLVTGEFFDDLADGKEFSPEAMLAAMLVARGAKARDYIEPTEPLTQPKKFLKMIYDALGVPPLLRRILAYTDQMSIHFSAGLVVAWNAANTAPLRLVNNPFGTPDMRRESSGDLLLASFDQHTSMGKRSVAYAKKAHPKYFEAMQNIKVSTSEVFGHAVFRVEGAFLAHLVDNDALDSLYWGSLEECWEVEGHSKAEAMQTYEYLADNLDDLHKARLRIWE